MAGSIEWNHEQINAMCADWVNQHAQRLDTIAQERLTFLEQMAGYSIEDARDALLHEAELDLKEDLQVRSYKLERQLKETLDERAKDILTSAIQRLAVPTANELTTSTVAIANEELKGKIIGKEGRNIRTFERASGVELLVDEAPDAIVVSCYDPVRRAIAVHALESLLKDGRIQPAKIEEEVEPKSKAKSKSKTATKTKAKPKAKAKTAVKKVSAQCGMITFLNQTQFMF